MAKTHYKDNPCRDDFNEELYAENLEDVTCKRCLSKNEQVENVEEVIEEAPPVAKAKVCGHVNRHSYGTDRKFDNMTCDLPVGHAGNHSGVHKELQKVEVAEIVGGEEVIHHRYDEKEVRRGWTDMAGTPVSELPTPEEAPQMTLLELDRRIRQLERSGAQLGNRKLSDIQVERG